MKSKYLIALLFFIPIFNKQASAQSIIRDSTIRTVIVKDSAKIQAVVTGNNNTINIGQSSKANKKIDKGKINEKEVLDFVRSKKYFSWNCNNWDKNIIKCESSFYFEEDSMIDFFSRIIVQVEELNGDSSLLKIREFYLPQKEENQFSLLLRKLKSPYKITVGLILKEDEMKEKIRVYSGSCTWEG